MTDPTSYTVIWNVDPLQVSVLECIPKDRFVLRGLESPEERTARKLQETQNTPEENLRRLFRDHFLSAWRASNLYSWMEQFAPGYEVHVGPGQAAHLTFANLNHVMLFKLTWT